MSGAQVDEKAVISKVIACSKCRVYTTMRIKIAIIRRKCKRRHRRMRSRWLLARVTAGTRVSAGDAKEE